jgi:hypothetical protein
MNIRHTVKVGQQWESNDPRRFPTVVSVDRITSYESGADVPESVVQGEEEQITTNDRVHVRNVATGKKTTIRRDQFVTGVRGWSLHKEAQ